MSPRWLHWPAAGGGATKSFSWTGNVGAGFVVLSSVPDWESGDFSSLDLAADDLRINYDPSSSYEIRFRHSGGLSDLKLFLDEFVDWTDGGSGEGFVKDIEDSPTIVTISSIHGSVNLSASATAAPSSTSWGVESSTGDEFRIFLGSGDFGTLTNNAADISSLAITVTSDFTA